MTNAKERMMKLLPEDLKNFVLEHEVDSDGDYNINISKVPTERVLDWLQKLDEKYDLKRDADCDYTFLYCDYRNCSITFISRSEYADLDREFAESAIELQISYDDSKEEELPIAILNTTILTSDGDFKLSTISLDEAKEIIEDREILSAVGHESTAQILSELLGVNVPINRINFKQEKGQTALCFKLKGRPEEGKILTIKDIESIGYEFKKLEMM